MCRNNRVLFNFDPPATNEEIRAASLQYVRKLSGMNKPAAVNEDEFNRAVEEVSEATKKLLASMSTTARTKDREVEKARAKARSEKRFGKPVSS